MSSEKIESTGKPRFSETMWFKKGEMDADAAVPATADAPPAPVAPVDSLPIEDRYVDDGTLTQGDSQKYSLRTGTTAMMQAMGRPATPRSRVSERELVREMTGSRMWIAGAVVLAAIGVVAGIAPMLHLIR